MNITGYMTREFYEALEEAPSINDLLAAIEEMSDGEMGDDVFVAVSVEIAQLEES